MTHLRQKERLSIYTQGLTLPLFLLFLIILLRFAAEIKNSIILGMKLTVSSVLPALFPFFILSDYLSASLKINEKGPLSRGFERVFEISPAALPAFLCGTVCGFPLGVRCAAELYESKAISKDECERLIGFTNNPSLAFVISSVGLGMRESLHDGILLYTAVILSAMAVGVLFRQKREKTSYMVLKSKQKFDLASSIKSAGHSALAISSFIIFFSAVLGAMGALSKSESLGIFSALFLEVGNAANMISLCGALSPTASMAITGFAIGFSGFSVHLQGFAFLPPEISKKRYLIMKFIQGVICGGLSFVFASF